MSKSKIQPTQVASRTEASKLKNLLANPQGLNGLIDFLTATVQEAEMEYVQASQKAVWTPEMRTDAIHKHGVKNGLQALLDRLVALRSNGA